MRPFGAFLGVVRGVSIVVIFCQSDDIVEGVDSYGVLLVVGRCRRDSVDAPRIVAPSVESS